MEITATNPDAARRSSTDEVAGAAMRRRDWICIGILLLLAMGFWAPRLRGPIDIRFDGGVYYVLGTSIAEGKGYRLLNEPGRIESVQYPPLLPLVVAAVEKLAGTSDFYVVGSWLRVWCIVTSVALTLATYGVARAFLSPWYALVASALAALHMNGYYLAELLYTEVPFALIAALFYLCWRKSDRRSYAVACAVLAVMAYLLRSAGLALLLAWVGESVLRRRWKQTAVRVVVSLIPVLLWQVHVHRVTSGEEYRHPAYPYQRAAYYYSNVTYAENARLIDSWKPELGPATPAQLASRVARNVLAVPERVGESLSAPVGIWNWAQAEALKRLHAPKKSDATLWRIVATIIGGIAIIGGATVLWRRRQLFLALFLLASIGLMCLTPWPEQFTRYLMPLSAFLATFFVAVLAFAARRLPSRYAIAAFSILIALCFAVELFMAARSLGPDRNTVAYYDAAGKRRTNRLMYYTPAWSDLDAGSEWVRRHASAGDVVCTITPQVTYAKFGLKSVLMPMDPDPTREQALLDSVPVKWVVVDSITYPDLSARYVRPAIEAHPDSWKKVYDAPHDKAQVYERVALSR